MSYDFNELDELSFADAMSIHNLRRWSSGALRDRGTTAYVVDHSLSREKERSTGSRTIRLAIDSKLRACDLVKLKVRDAANGDRVTPRAIIMQQKTHRPVQFEIT